MRRNAVLSVVILIVVLAMSNAAFAQKATVLRVLIVKTDNVAAYVQEVEKGRQVGKSIGLQGVLRVWQARFAGSQAGTVVVSVEYASMATLAADDAKVNASSDYQAWLKGLDKIRTITSDSLYREW